jgi:hypothetical protein
MGNTISNFYDALNKAWDKEPETLIELGITDKVFANIEKFVTKDKLVKMENKAISLEDKLLVVAFLNRPLFGDGEKFSLSVGMLGKGVRFLTDSFNDYNDIMPAVDKIESLGFEFISAENRCKIRRVSDNSEETIINFTFCGSSRKETTYSGVVEFIKWHNALN